MNIKKRILFENRSWKWEFRIFSINMTYFNTVPALNGIINQCRLKIPIAKYEIEGDI